MNEIELGLLEHFLSRAERSLAAARIAVEKGVYTLATRQFNMVVLNANEANMHGLRLVAAERDLAIARATVAKQREANIHAFLEKVEAERDDLQGRLKFCLDNRS